MGPRLVDPEKFMSRSYMACCFLCMLPVFCLRFAVTFSGGSQVELGSHSTEGLFRALHYNLCDFWLSANGIDRNQIGLIPKLCHIPTIIIVFEWERTTFYINSRYRAILLFFLK